MAKRRMFSQDVVLTDKFTNMSAEAQALYLQLSMQADDDGFVGSPNRITRGCGFPPAALEELKQKGYLLFFPSDICVIAHWLVSNCIQKDRYKDTIYLEEREQLLVKENREYVTSDDNVNKEDSFCIQNGSKVYTQESIGKDRVGKDSSVKERVDQDSLNQEREENIKHPHGMYQNVYLTDEEYLSLQNEYPAYSDMIENLSRKIEMKGYQYQNHFVTLKEWAKEDAKRKEVPPAPAQPASRYDYDYIKRAAHIRTNHLNPVTLQKEEPYESDMPDIPDELDDIEKCRLKGIL